jgi:hypothetical protein
MGPSSLARLRVRVRRAVPLDLRGWLTGWHSVRKGGLLPDLHNRARDDDVVTDQEFAESVLRAAAGSASEAAIGATRAFERYTAALAAITARLNSARETWESAEDPARRYAAVIEVAPAFEAADAAKAASDQAMRAYKSAMQVFFLSGAAVLQAVRAVGTVIQEPSTTVADLRGLVVELQTTVREVERQRAAAAAGAQAPGLTLATYRWTVAGSLAGIVGALIALLAYVQTTIEAKRPDPTPNVTVVAPQPNVTIVVPPAPAPQQDDDPGSHPQDRRGTDR